VPAAPPVVTSPPSAGSPPAAPGAVYTPPAAGSPPAAPGAVFAPGGAVPQWIKITGITSPAGASTLVLALTDAYGPPPAWNNAAWLLFYDEDPGELRWKLVKTSDPSQYQADNESAAISPIGLTGWAMVEGEGAPTIAAYLPPPPAITP
jgi:hypothetical protein